MERLVMTVAEAAEALGISPGTAYQLIRERRLPSIQLGVKRIVVPRAALERFLVCQTAGAIDQEAEKEVS